MVATKKRAYDNSARAAAAEQTRERIMRAAIDLFMTASDWDDLTIPRIAETAGVSPQTVVLHFKTKDTLVEATCRWWAPRETELRAVESGDPLEAAKQICDRYETLGPPTLRVLALEERVPAVRPLLDHGRASHRAWVERTFGAKLGSGAARERRVMALVVAYDVYTWDVLRRQLAHDDVVHTMAALARGVIPEARDSKGGKR
jgi:AcrR family transcriptional regulator